MKPSIDATLTRLARLTWPEFVAYYFLGVISGAVMALALIS